MAIYFETNLDGLFSLKRLFKKITLDDYRMILKREELSIDAYHAGRVFLKELIDNSPFSPQDLKDEMFEDGFISIEVMLSDDEISSFLGFVKSITILELEKIIKNKEIAKKVGEALWIVRESLYKYVSNIDRQII